MRSASSSSASSAGSSPWRTPAGSAWTAHRPGRAVLLLLLVGERRVPEEVLLEPLQLDQGGRLRRPLGAQLEPAPVHHLANVVRAERVLALSDDVDEPTAP